MIVGKILVYPLTNITFNSIPSSLQCDTLQDDGMLLYEGQLQGPTKNSYPEHEFKGKARCIFGME